MKIKIGDTCYHEKEHRYAKSFNKNAYRIIDELSYYFYVISLDKNSFCTCYNFDTKQGDSSCKKCLGRGYRITIKEVQGACMSTKLGASQREVKDVVLGNVYFIKENHIINKDDLIIDDDNVFQVSQKRRVKSFNGQHKYNKYLCVHLKHGKERVMENFFEILDKKRRGLLK